MVRLDKDMYMLKIAGEELAIPKLIFNYQGKENIFNNSKKDLINVINLLRKYEFGALILKHNSNYYILFFDKKGYAKMCGHGSLGITYLLSNLLKVQEITFETESGRINGVCKKRNLQINMPIAETIKEQIYECGNKFLVKQLNKYENFRLNQIITTSQNYIKKNEIYGVIWFSIQYHIENIFFTHSVTIFGNQCQQDMSPCGTGSCSLSKYLKDKYNKDSLKLINKSLNGFAFNVLLNKKDKPILSYDGDIKVTNIKLKGEYKINNHNWLLQSLK